MSEKTDNPQSFPIDSKGVSMILSDVPKDNSTLIQTEINKNSDGFLISVRMFFENPEYNVTPILVNATVYRKDFDPEVGDSTTVFSQIIYPWVLE